MYFQVQFKKFHCTAITKNAIKYELKKEQRKQVGERFASQKRRYHDNSKKEKHAAKERYLDKSK